MEIVTTERPWGSFTRFTYNELSTVKYLRIKKGEAFSLQYHTHRTEFWKVISGHPEVTIGEEVKETEPEQEFTILPTMLHRIQAVKDNVVILEISTGDFDEEDIVRIEDMYGRI